MSHNIWTLVEDDVEWAETVWEHYNHNRFVSVENQDDDNIGENSWVAVRRDEFSPEVHLETKGPYETYNDAREVAWEMMVGQFSTPEF